MRGHQGLPTVAPGNTPASFAAAAAAGATWVELDVRPSADRELMVVHDPRASDGTPVAALTARALGAYGVWRLGDVLTQLPEGLGVDIEVKNRHGEVGRHPPSALVALLARVVASARSERPLMTSSFDLETVAAMAEGLPGVAAGVLHGAGVGLSSAVESARQRGAAVVCSHRRAVGLTARWVQAAHDAGLSVMVWTVDKPAKARALTAAGVDAICTNDPAGLAAALAGDPAGGTR
jgi:glycerophosphoryl diester phosphodiesterase